jgi:hypothetical protein
MSKIAYQSALILILDEIEGQYKNLLKLT